MLSARAQKHIRLIIVYLLLTLISLFFLLPVIWTFLTSLKMHIDAVSIPPVWKFKPIWQNYIDAWHTKDFARSFINTIVVGLGTVFLNLLIGIPAAYSLARYKIKGAGMLEVWFLLVRMLPEMLFIVPLYVLYRKFGLYDTNIGLILVFQIFNLPYSIWLLRQFIAEVPREIEEAGRIDGCSEFQVLLKLTLPLIAPGVVATSILSFIVVWTNLLFPLSLTYSNAKLVSIGIAGFKGYGSFNLPLMAAASIIAILPQIL
ncbi:MAG: carbohydrate ABC transporter permease, partial [Firmicutes bacterium]|nr:carbohydrate ABC transporter permease [Bacillota bacterium]